MDTIINFFEDTFVHEIPYDDAKIVTIKLLSENINSFEVDTIIIKLNTMVNNHRLHGNRIMEINQLCWFLNI